MPWENGNDGGRNPWDNSSGSRGGGGRRSGGGGGKRPDPNLDEFLQGLRDQLPQGFKFGSGFTFLLAALLVIWALSGFYRVQADEQGVVLRFGEFHTQTNPGLNYHLPWPIESAVTPKVTTVNRIDIGMRTVNERQRNANYAVPDVPEESLMLTGDENIVDVDFSVFWLITDAPAYLFNVENPEATIKAVAESTMREIIGQNEIQPILTGQRQTNEEKVKDLMQKTLDSYGAGIGITQVKLQKVDPPAAVIDAFRDVQAARADQERARNEANSYANRVVPEAKGEAEGIRREAEAYRTQTIADADGQASRFAAIYEEYRDAKGVTRERIYLETLERVMENTNKVIIDENSANGIVPYLPLNELNNKKGAR